MYIISACLAGVNCKYNGKNNFDETIERLIKEGKGILVCPEQLGGLTTPRPASEIVENESGKVSVLTKEGKDVTAQFLKGAEETVRLAKTMDADVAILKARSPSCGYRWVYDGTFSGKLKPGRGMTADRLIKAGIKVFTEEDDLSEL